ncbi:TOM1-like protein 1 isoform X1 [Cricetulus griseus]|uniref:TOM1-like protein 1 isoform X1 n=1 Tax=Cricetulus griseus TaxID=10029 RepID=A0A8C2LY01_CRIGR|nr:TOM1-like protein 1 isoform X1 [Cricetulus griseus]XP_027282068.1 TOM1-like protein 1 isoform X1 [Cricetulus griseus]
MAFGKSHRDPYATSVGHLVEKATFAGVQTEDWGQFMHICDIINTTQDGPKDAVKALKKRISKNYNHKEIQLSLSLIDMCMQNCGPSFQSLIVKKEFIKDALVKLLNPRYTLPLDIQNRILNFIKTWSQGFPGGVDVSEVKEVYLDLLKKGVQFPPSDADTETRQEAAQLSPHRPTPVPTAPALSSIIAPKTPTISLVPEQIGKLHSELDMVKMNVKVMTAILMENTPGSENHEDIELLQKLYKTGREMQERIMDLLVVVENEDVTVELIQVNEDLNNAILGYERFTRNQQRLLEQNRNSKDATDTSNEPSAPSCDLLDLSPIVPMPMSNGEALHTVNSQLSALSVSSPSPVVTNSLYPSLHPQVDLLASENTELPSLFAQRTSPNLASSHTYDNFLEHSSSVLLQPVSLQTATAAPASQRLPTLPSNHPVITNNDLQPPNYYEVMEFDPLAPATEAVYEEIDDYHHKGAQSHSDC